MKTWTAFVLLWTTTLFASAQTTSLTALQIIDKATQLTQGNSAKGELEMTIQRPSWSRTITMKTWSLGRSYSMIYISAPARDKGQVFLKRKNEMWNWMPSISRMIKIPGSMMGQSWMGSDFTNDDLVRLNALVTDYTHTILLEEPINGLPCWKIELIPKADAAVVWGKLEIWVAQTGFYTLQQKNYDEDLELVSTMQASDIRTFGDRKLPARMELTPADQSNQKTIIVNKGQEFNIAIEESFFSQQNMKRIR